jgi:hypothetical protein
MPISFILFMVSGGICFVVIIAALMIHGIWVAPFIERHGVRTAGFLIFGMCGGVGLIQDYLAARRICRERRIKPRWMSWFTSLLVAAGALLALILGYILFSFLHR